MSHQGGETVPEIRTKQPTIDDFRNVAEQRGELPDGVIEVDADAFTYPVSERSWDDVAKTDPTPPSPPSRLSAQSELERIGRHLSNYFQQIISANFGPGHFEVPLTINEHAIIIGEIDGLNDPSVGEIDLVELSERSAFSGVPVAIAGSNCISYDPMFDVHDEIPTFTGLLDTIPLPREVYREFDINPAKITVLDIEGKRAPDVLFHDGEDYYFRGGEPRDGWVGRLDMAVSTIEEAKQEALRPDAVIAADQQGRDVKRQGDWFFVETDDEPTGIVRHPDVGVEGEDTQLGNHIAEWQGIKIDAPPRVFAKGMVEHLTDDHDHIQLTGWHEAINNGVEAYSYETALATPDHIIEIVANQEPMRVRSPNGVSVSLGTPRRTSTQNSSSTSMRFD